MDEELNRFFQLFLETLSWVDQSYYATTYENMEAIHVALQGRGQIVNGNFERYGERIFCYEFYHRLSIKMYLERKTNGNFLQGAKLQGEVRKMQVAELIDALGLEQLDGEYTPDFLVHTPGNADYHACVIEVKCEPNLSSGKMLTDIKKINQFVTRYNYQLGIFLAVNITPDELQNRYNEISEEVAVLEGRDRIRIVCKASQNSGHHVWQLN
jgi:hypothetical protein